MMALPALLLAVALPSALADLAVKNPYDPNFYANPWPATCQTQMQSPINLPMAQSLPPVPDDLITDIRMPVVKDAITKNVGSAMQVSWNPATAFNMSDDTFPMVAAGGDSISDVILKGSPVEFMLKMIPVQIHWHETSEHAVGGLLAPMEAHIVTVVGPGEAPEDWGCDALWEGGDVVFEKCIAVFGIIYEMSDTDESPVYLENVFKSFPAIAGTDAPFPTETFDLGAILPTDLSYDSYIGSLTTPPCSEGLRWHVFTEYRKISLSTVSEFEELMANITDIETGNRQLYRHNNRPVQPLNSRKIWHYDASPTMSLHEGGMRDGDRTRRPRRPRGD